MPSSFPSMIISARAGRGYAIDRASPGIDRALQQIIRKKWAPPGQRWSQFAGARFIRTIELPDHQCAWIQGKVTVRRDEFGRGGLLRARITILPRRSLVRLVKDYVSRLPGSAQSAGRQSWPEPMGLSWRTLRKKQTVFAAPAAWVARWAAVEYVVLGSFLRLPAFLRDAATVDTLVLSTRGAGTLVGIPAEYLKGKAHVRLSNPSLK